MNILLILGEIIASYYIAKAIWYRVAISQKRKPSNTDVIIAVICTAFIAIICAYVLQPNNTVFHFITLLTPALAGLWSACHDNGKLTEQEREEKFHKMKHKDEMNSDSTQM